MHAEAYQYCREALQRLGGVRGLRILEIGSHNVNGGVRELCGEAAFYWGIDPWPGPGVDQVCSAFGYVVGPDYDLVVCTEVLEHMPQPWDAIACARRALKPGGYLILTAAGNGRAPHSCDGGPLKPDEPYGNIDQGWLSIALDDREWEVLDLSYLPGACDVRALARRLETE